MSLTPTQRAKGIMRYIKAFGDREDLALGMLEGFFRAAKEDARKEIAAWLREIPTPYEGSPKDLADELEGKGRFSNEDGPIM